MFQMIVPYDKQTTKVTTIADCNGKSIKYSVTTFSGRVHSCGGWGTTYGFLVNRVTEPATTVAFASADHANFYERQGTTLWIPEPFIESFTEIAKKLDICLNMWGKSTPWPVEDGLYKLAKDSTKKLVKV